MENRPGQKSTAARSAPGKAGGTRVRRPRPIAGRDWYLGLGLVLAVLLVYAPIWRAGYIWDDDAVVTANPVIVGPLGLKEIWTSSAADICPLTLTTFWFEHALWGLAPLPYHLFNVFMHAACAVALWRVLRSLSVPGAWLGAALWALHPVQVESVAWITELKNTQSGLFFLLTILFFVRWVKAGQSGGPPQSGRDYALTLIFAAMAIASKSSTVVLPVILILCARWIDGRFRWHTAVSLVPICFMSAAACALSIWTQRLRIGAIADHLPIRTWPERLAGAGDATWFYLVKLIWPSPLVTIYPGWQIGSWASHSFLPLVGIAVILGILGLMRQSWSRSALFISSCFLITLLPVLGLIDNPIFRYSLVFDHFQYLASMAPLAGAAAVLTRAAESIFPGKTMPPLALGAIVLLIVGTVSWQQTGVYESQETLWTDTLAKNPNCDTAHYNLGEALVQKGDLSGAIAQFQKALESNPNSVEACANLGTALQQAGREDEAIVQFRKAVSINPEYDVAQYDLGSASLKAGRVDEAVGALQKTLEINPAFPGVHHLLGLVFAQKGEQVPAESELRKALESSPGDIDARNKLASILSASGRADEAIAEYGQVIVINPQSAEAHYNLGAAYAQKGQMDKAIPEFQKTVEINPRDANAYYNLGLALLQNGNAQDAASEFEIVLRLNPSDSDALANLNRAKARR